MIIMLFLLLLLAKLAVVLMPGPLRRIYVLFPATIEHLVSFSALLVPTDYLPRYGSICQYINGLKCAKYNLPWRKRNWCEHKPKSVTHNENISALCILSVQRNRIIPANKQDIFVNNFLEKVLGHWGKNTYWCKYFRQNVQRRK